ncbi:deaminase [Sneathiella marina]|uniref:Deaminase n=1 Tax=Sneathiella marina TaxID=2950108 RepID=A0ABY4W7A9_9PROT|nr:deaminase [Sneathiella marina]USG62018.1 deaminase [Sneathiella marina]
MSEKNREFKWHQRFMGLCNHISEWTEDRDFKVGAVIVGPDNEIRSTGFNGLPRDIEADEEDRFNRESGEKFFWFEHAERNAIYNAARFGAAISGCTIYVNRYPCADCARAIIQSGIKTLCCPAKPLNDGALDHSFDVSEILLKEAGIMLLIQD